jgi:hypothetical protein
MKQDDNPVISLILVLLSVAGIFWLPIGIIMIIHDVTNYWAWMNALGATFLILQK